MEKKYEWWVRLTDGRKYETSMEGWKSYIDPAALKPGVYELLIDGDELHYKIEGTNYGCAFKGALLDGPDIYVTVFIADPGDYVHLLRGSSTTAIPNTATISAVTDA